MPTLDGLKRLLALWRRYVKGEPKPTDAKDWWALFGYLADLRTWSAQDRVDPTIREYVDRSIERFPDRPVKIELDLWFREDPVLRESAQAYVQALVDTVGGQLLDFSTIEQIRYQAALVEVPGEQARALQNQAGLIANADAVMRVKPQSLFASIERESETVEQAARLQPGSLDGRPAIVALLDGYPIQNHSLLANRVDVEEVDITGRDVPVARRFHGTSMASLILHGDLALQGPTLTRALKVVPILAAPQGAHTECTPLDKLPLAMVHRAVMALVEGLDGEDPQGENVVILNHSICDNEGAFARRPSAWAKLLDYLSHEYRLLFVVSAGNIHAPFEIDTYASSDEFSNAGQIERQIVLLRGVERAKGGRVILSPAEAVNALTVGAVHEDGADPAPAGHIDPFAGVGVANLCSGIGLGINRAIKPDLIEAGGRQVALSDEDDGTVSVWGSEISSIGQLTAVADPNGGDVTKQGRSTGTSNAAALVTRSAVQIADVVEGIFAENGQDWSLEPTRAVVLKALLAHGCSWGDAGVLLNETYPPSESTRWQRRREAISRFIGYGRANNARIVTEHGSRITLLADDLIGHDARHEYSIPIPRAMIANREVRRVIATLAWSSPIDPGSLRYRGFGLDIVDANGKRKFWEGVGPILQPPADAGRRGTLQHMILEGKKLMNAGGSGTFSLGVQARAALSRFEAEEVPYALAITLEMAQPVRQDLFADVAARIRPKAPVTVRAPIRPRIRS
jgi:hypothetical protein